MKHHEVVVDFNRRGMMQLLKRVFTRPQTTSQSEEARDYQVSLRELPRQAIYRAPGGSGRR